MSLQHLLLALDDLQSVGANSFPRTRAEALALARIAADPDAGELHILAVAEAGESCELIEIARLELSRSESDTWYLQYVSHPNQSMGLTTLIAPSEDDFLWRLRREHAGDWVPVVAMFSSNDMSSEGLGPDALLDLRVTNSFPVVPCLVDAPDLPQPAAAADGALVIWRQLSARPVPSEGGQETRP